jgi:hypothetical protein
MGRLAIEPIRGAIWLRPEGLAADALEEAITSLRERYGGPGAWPHVSLGDGIECLPHQVEPRLSQLAAELPPLTIRVAGVGWHDDYWRCLYLRVGLTRELREAHRAVCEAFDLEPEPDFEPRIPLLYGDYTADRKRQIALELDDDLLDLSFEATAIHFVNAAPEVLVEDWRSQHERLLAHRLQELVAARARVAGAIH